jgi:hypothetical protein
MTTAGTTSVDETEIAGGTMTVNMNIGDAV